MVGQVLPLLLRELRTCGSTQHWTFRVLGNIKSQLCVQEVLRGAPPTAADVDRLPRCCDVVLETLRVHPPAYMVGRCAAVDTTLPVPSAAGSSGSGGCGVAATEGGGSSGGSAAGSEGGSEGSGGYRIPAGTTALVAPYLLHLRPHVWGDDAGSFRPARWPRLRAAGAVGASWRSALAGLGPGGCYIPFGGGPRNCVGTGFAFLEAVLVLAMILQRVRLEPPERGAPFPPPAPLITLRPEQVRVRLRTRVPRRRR